MGIKGAQMGQEFAQRNLDQQRLKLLLSNMILAYLLETLAT